MSKNRAYLAGFLVICIFHIFAHVAKALPQPAFGAPSEMTFTNLVEQFMTGDFDNDGKADLLVQTINLSNATKELILLSKFDGAGFIGLLKLPLTNRINAHSTGDFNNDGNLDILVMENAGSDCDRYTVFSGDGMGDFNPVQVMLNSPTSVVFVAVSDIDGDGNADFVTSGRYYMQAFMGNGDGSFNYQKNHLGAGGPIVLANINFDLKPDLMFCPYDLFMNVKPPTVYVRLNRGDGTFGETNTYVRPNIPLSYKQVLAGDLNGDGRADLIFTYGGAVSVRLNNGNGTFGEDKLLPGNQSDQTLNTADFNGDGLLDIFTASTISLGHGDGTFEAFTNNLQSGMGRVGDFNGDGKPDIVFSVARSIQRKLLIRLNETEPAIKLLSADLRGATNVYFTNPPPTSYSLGGSQRMPVIADLNGDGAPDVAIPTPGSHGAKVILNDGIGGLGPITNFLVSFSSSSVDSAVGDFNNDGNQDLIFSNLSTNLLLLLGDGRGGLTQTTNVSIGLGQAGWVEAGHFNSDTNLDLAVGILGRELVILLGQGNGTFGQPIGLSVFSDMMAIGDFNSDGFDDILVSSGRLMLGNGDGTFHPAGSFPGGASLFVLGDFNHDGNLDFGTRNYQTFRVYLGDGQGYFTTDFVMNNTPVSDVGDFDMDGHLDLIGIWDSRLKILRGIGDGTFVTYTHTNWLTSSGDYLFGVDFNMDEKPDLLKLGGNSLVRYFNQTPWPTPPPATLGGNVKVQWPAWSGFILESTTNVSLTESWSSVTNEFTTRNGNYVLTNQMINENRFYRLKRPESE